MCGHGSRACTIALAALAVSACGPRRIPAPGKPAPAIVVLLPDADGKIGKVRVSNEFGSADLTSERHSVSADANRRPGTVTTLAVRDVERLFGGALEALPQAPQYFTLYFQFESDQLTEQSRALLPKILQAVKERAIPEVTVVGHTDTTGPPQKNIALGLKRAEMVRGILVKAGLPAGLIEVTSHGEADLLMRTPDGTAEAHNRRVEISVR